mgnify:FL=1|tara:strand:+ start:1129 stop:1920 length:792 start_codon:yes stop_codon:yes gene_type:complete
MKTYRSFKDARKFARSLNLKKRDGPHGWKAYCKSGNKPEDIPSAPDTVYKKEWKGMGDWLGTGVVARQKRKWRSFKEAREFVHTLKLKDYQEWEKYYKSGNKPDDIPTNPYTSYKNKGWINYVDWLGTDKITSDRNFKSFDDAKKFVQKFEFKNMAEYRKWCEKNKPADIPYNPQRVYKNKGWKDWGDWVGTNYVSNSVKAKNYLPWKEAKIEYRKLAKKYGLKNGSDWIKFAKSHKKLLDDLRISGTPSISYSREKVWRKMK